MAPISNISNALDGFLAGIRNVSSYRRLSSVLQGQTDFIAFQQTLNLNRLASSSFRTMNEMKIWESSKTQRRWLARAVSFPLPFALQMLNHRVNANTRPYLKKSIVFLRNNLDRVILISNVCLCILYTYYVSPIFGIGYVAGLSIELMNEYKIVPAKVKAVWEKFYFVLQIGNHINAAFIEEYDNFDIALVVGKILIYVWEHYFPPKLPPDFLQHRLTYNKAQELLKNSDRLQVNFDHLYIHPKLGLPGAESINIVESMDGLIKKVIGNETNLVTFKKMLIDNTRFTEQTDKREIEAITDACAKEEFKTGAETFAREIAFSSIKKGDVNIQYDLLQMMLKSVLKSLEEATDFEYDLFLLASDGGDFCAAGKIEVLEEIYNRRVLGTGKIPLKPKFLHQLISKRKRWFDSVYARFSDYARKLPKGIIDPSDIHFRNIALFYFSKFFKIYSDSLENDMTVSARFCNHLYRLMVSFLLEYTFWPYALKSHLYSPQAVTDEVVEACSFLGISSTEVSEWWEEWVKTLPERQQEEVSTELFMEGTVFGQPLFVKTTKFSINPKLAKLMLYDMKILN